MKVDWRRFEMNQVYTNKGDIIKGETIPGKTGPLRPRRHPHLLHRRCDGSGQRQMQALWRTAAEMEAPQVEGVFIRGYSPSTDR